MAVLFMDGFDHYAATDFLKKWSVHSGTPALSVGNGRNGTTALVMSANTNCSKGLPNLQTVIVGVAVNMSAGLSNAPVIRLMDGGTTQVEVDVVTDGSIKVYRSGPTLLGQSAVGVLKGAAYQYIELKATIHPTAGTVDVRVNGTSVLSLTGQNTRQSANSYATLVNLYSPNTSTYFDDFYICDTSGPDNNDFLGDMRVDLELPAGEGTYSQFTPNTGLIHYNRVAETQPDTTSYNYSGTVGQKDTYQFGDLSSVTGTIKAVQVTVTAMKDDAGTRQIAALLKSGSTEAQGASTALSTSQTMISTVVATDPATGAAWTEAGVNALEAGVIVTG